MYVHLDWRSLPIPNISELHRESRRIVQARRLETASFTVNIPIRCLAHASGRNSAGERRWLKVVFSIGRRHVDKVLIQAGNRIQSPPSKNCPFPDECLSLRFCFSMQVFNTNVLIWKMFVTSPTKAAKHLGPNYLLNSEIYKNTKNQGYSKSDQYFSEVCDGTF